MRTTNGNPKRQIKKEFYEGNKKINPKREIEDC